jgi:hypothetical protein
VTDHQQIGDLDRQRDLGLQGSLANRRRAGHAALGAAAAEGVQLRPCPLERLLLDDVVALRLERGGTERHGFSRTDDRGIEDGHALEPQPVRRGQAYGCLDEGAVAALRLESDES